MSSILMSQYNSIIQIEFMILIEYQHSSKTEPNNKKIYLKEIPYGDMN